MTKKIHLRYFKTAGIEGSFWWSFRGKNQLFPLTNSVSCVINIGSRQIVNWGLSCGGDPLWSGRGSVQPPWKLWSCIFPCVPTLQLLDHLRGIGYQSSGTWEGGSRWGHGQQDKWGIGSSGQACVWFITIPALRSFQLMLKGPELQWGSVDVVFSKRAFSLSCLVCSQASSLRGVTLVLSYFSFCYSGWR